MANEDATTNTKILREKALEVAKDYHERTKHFKYKIIKKDSKTTLLRRVK